MESVLEKTRGNIELVDQSQEGGVDVAEVTTRVASVTDSTVLVIDAQGHVVALAPRRGVEVRDEVQEGREVPRTIREALLRLQHPETNVRRDDLLAVLRRARDRVATAIPMRIGERRMGTFLLLREGDFEEKDLALAELAVTVLELDVRRGMGEGTAAGREAVLREQIRSAFRALSLSEAEAVWHILGELRGTEGTVVASRVADRVGITRSVIVNALRKLESAMVIRSRSLGMKGTYIKILNPYLNEELRRFRTRR